MSQLQENLADKRTKGQKDGRTDGETDPIL